MLNGRIVETTSSMNALVAVVAKQLRVHFKHGSMDMFERIKIILENYTEGTIDENSTLEADLGLSSFDVVEIVTEFEEAFGIKIPDRDISHFVCVKDIVDYLKERV